jgi:hypothetical protein
VYPGAREHCRASRAACVRIERAQAGTPANRPPTPLTLAGLSLTDINLRAGRALGAGRYSVCAASVTHCAARAPVGRSLASFDGHCTLPLSTIDWNTVTTTGVIAVLVTLVVECVAKPVAGGAQGADPHLPVDDLSLRTSDKSRTPAGASPSPGTTVHWTTSPTRRCSAGSTTGAAVDRTPQTRTC